MVSATCATRQGLTPQSEESPLPPPSPSSAEFAQTIPLERLGLLLEAPPWSLWSRAPARGTLPAGRADARRQPRRRGEPIPAGSSSSSSSSCRRKDGVEARRGDNRARTAHTHTRSLQVRRIILSGPVAPWTPDDRFGAHHLREAGERRTSIGGCWDE